MLVFRDIDLDEIDLINGLWNENAEHHRLTSEYFKSNSSKVLFQDRVEDWKKCKEIKITIIENENIGIGYCISSINNKYGNIESIFIKENMRKKGIGKKVILEHIKWMKSNECKRINVATSYGNKDAIEFYKKLNILPKKIIFELK